MCNKIIFCYSLVVIYFSSLYLTHVNTQFNYPALSSAAFLLGFITNELFFRDIKHYD